MSTVSSFHLVIILALFALVPKISIYAFGAHEAQVDNAADSSEITDSGDGYPAYLSLVDGLHVTGTPVVVDIETYKLQISGLVENDRGFSFDEIKAMPSEKIEMKLECPGFFIDEGVWTGVRLETFLKEAGVDEKAGVVRFISADGDYAQNLALSEVLGADVLIAYEFNGEEFPVYHGFPLRIAARDQPGAVWVKWLGSIVVR